MIASLGFEMGNTAPITSLFIICYLCVVLWVSVILPGIAGGKFKADPPGLKIPERVPPKEPEMSAQLTHTLTH